MIFTLTWWLIGFCGAALSGYFMPGGDAPFTYRRLIVCSVCAFAAPVTIFAAMVFGAMFVMFGDFNRPPKPSRITKWLDRPVFRNKGAN